MTEAVYHIRIGFDPKYEKEMHSLFDVGSGLQELFACYRHENGMWYIEHNTPQRGIKVNWSIVDEVEEE